MSRSLFANGSRRATVRTASCDGVLKLPGICTAIQDPGASAPAQRTNRSRCLGTHCNVALLTTTSVSGLGLADSTSPTCASTPRSLADSTISGELSHASITASGQRSASVAVRLPGPQPRSTTRRGFSAPTRDVRSKKGLPRWSAKVR